MTPKQEITEALLEFIDPGYLEKWFNMPNASFDNLTPNEVIERGEASRLWEMIYR